MDLRFGQPQMNLHTRKIIPNSIVVENREATKDSTWHRYKIDVAANHSSSWPRSFWRRIIINCGNRLISPLQAFILTETREIFEKKTKTKKTWKMCLCQSASSISSITIKNDAATKIKRQTIVSRELHCVKFVPLHHSHSVTSNMLRFGCYEFQWSCEFAQNSDKLFCYAF